MSALPTINPGIEALAVAFVAATKKRAQARSHLSALRQKWMEEYETYFDTTESSTEEDYPAMMAALKAREECNAEYRRAKSRLFRACVRIAGPEASLEQVMDTVADMHAAEPVAWRDAHDHELFYTVKPRSLQVDPLYLAAGPASE